MDWLFYIAHTHLNYTKEEFWNSTYKEICKMWEYHVKFNSPETNEEITCKKVKTTIDKIPFL